MASIDYIWIEILYSFIYLFLNQEFLDQMDEEILSDFESVGQRLLLLISDEDQDELVQTLTSMTISQEVGFSLKE